MTTKKQDYKVGDLVRRGINTYEIKSITKEPTALLHDIVMGHEITEKFSELATYDHYPHSIRIGRPPKPRKAEATIIPTIAGVDRRPGLVLSGGVIVQETKVEQASTVESGAHHTTPETALPEEPVSSLDTIIPPVDEIMEPISAEDIDKPTKLDPSTFEMQVKGEGRYQHKMTLSGKEASGKNIKPTLLRLLEQFGITGSPAEIASKLETEYPVSSERARMLIILKEGG